MSAFLTLRAIVMVIREPGVTWLGSLTHRDSHLALFAQAGHAEVCAVYRGSSARGVCWWCLVACLVRSLNPEPHARPMLDALDSVTDRQYEEKSGEEGRVRSLTIAYKQPSRRIPQDTFHHHRRIDRYFPSCLMLA